MCCTLGACVLVCPTDGEIRTKPSRVGSHFKVDLKTFYVNVVAGRTHFCKYAVFY